MLTLEIIPYEVSEYKSWDDEGFGLWWLGQAGFLIRTADTTILIDPYLSDFLAEKYKGQKFPHIRMMPSPINMEDLTGIDYCISSHSHSDHMDPGLIPILLKSSPACRFIIPEAVRSVALERGVPERLILGMDAGVSLSLSEDIILSAIPAAHEEIKTNGKGQRLFLGYFLKTDGFTLFHPGDCLPYEDLDSWLEPHEIDLALMPVNGQRDELSSLGIAGNFSIEQACQIMKKHDIKYMIPQHIGMFDFNTVSRDDLDRVIDASDSSDRIFPAEIDVLYHLVRK